MITFLADLLQVFSRHHKRIQDDKLTIMSLVQSIRSLRSAISNLQTNRLIGGWEETLHNDIDDSDGILFLKGFELQDGENRRIKRVEFSEEVRSSIIDSILVRLSERFDTDELLMDIINPFVTFCKDADLRKIHELFGNDLDSASLQLQYNELVEQKIAWKLNGHVNEVIKTLTSNPTTFKNYNELITVLGRIHVCTPHSADTERCISANNRLKTPLRSSILLETEVKYLYLHFNMPALETWNPRQAIKLWMCDKKRKDFSNVIDKRAKNAPWYKGIFETAHDEPNQTDAGHISVKKFKIQL